MRNAASMFSLAAMLAACGSNGEPAQPTQAAPEPTAVPTADAERHAASAARDEHLLGASCQIGTSDPCPAMREYLLALYPEGQSKPTPQESCISDGNGGGMCVFSCTMKSGRPRDIAWNATCVSLGGACVDLYCLP